MDRPPLTVFTPLPPERNGIADYAHALLGALATHYDVAVACDDWTAAAPAGVPVLDPWLAHRHVAPGGRVLHQLGNNAGHAFVLRALRTLPGVVTLHDPALLHLHEMVGEWPTILGGMLHPDPRLADRFARHLTHHDLSSTANHALFDLAGEVLARARAVIVHSPFARARLRATHGEAATTHVHVIPHPLLPAPPAPDRAAARATLGLPSERLILLTAGFATRPKGFPAIAAALSRLPPTVAAPLWVHAGEDGPPLQHPAVAPRVHVTGWLDAAPLARWLAAADVLVNLRFPSRGESSGMLARALGAGLACIVSDTAAYAELPRDAVLHLPVTETATHLAHALTQFIRHPDAARALGARGRAHAEATLTLPAIARAHVEVIEAAANAPSNSPGAGPPASARTVPPTAVQPAPAPSTPTVGPPASASSKPTVRPHGPTPLAPPIDSPPPLRVAPALTAAAVRGALAGVTGPCRLLLPLPNLDALADLSLDQPGLLRAMLPPWAVPQAVRVLDAPDGAGLLIHLDLPWRPR